MIMFTDMKLFFNLVMVLFLAGCNYSNEQEGNLKLFGSIENYNGGMVVLERITQGGALPVDTIEVVDNSFQAKVKVSGPDFYRLNLEGRQYVSMILSGNEGEIEVHAEGDNPRGFSEISGSYDTNFKSEMDIVMTDFQTSRGEMQQVMIQARSQGDVEAYNTSIRNMEGLAKDAERDLKALIWQATPSLAAYYGIQMIDAESNFHFIDSVYQKMDASIPNHYLVKNLGVMVDTKRNLAIGEPAPEISLPSPDGELVSLSSLRGNYVLIDFWAAWCKPCRAENPNVVRMYNKYSDKNFEILGVSLDRTKEAWLKAIDQDQLPWMHVSDLKFWNSIAAKTYQISSIPATYLIDPEGNIIAKNLRGPSLEKKLAEIFG